MKENCIFEKSTIYTFSGSKRGGGQAKIVTSGAMNEQLISVMIGKHDKQFS